MLQIIRSIFMCICLAVIVQPGHLGAAPVEWLLVDPSQDKDIVLFNSDIVLPGADQVALTFYKNGDFRQAAEKLERIRSLMLPDGQLDYICFLLAESYRQLEIDDKAIENYSFITSHFASSAFCAPSFFRLQGYAYAALDSITVENISVVFKKQFRTSSLYNSVMYTTGLVRFKNTHYAEAINVLSEIPAGSQRYAQAQLVKGLCYIELKEPKKALLLFQYLEQQKYNPELVYEAMALMADIYYLQKQTDVARRYYSAIPQKSQRFSYAQVKLARCFLDNKELSKARSLAEHFLKKREDQDYFFEMASILSLIYAAQGDKNNAQKIDNLISRQIVNAKTAFEISGELKKTLSQIRAWEILDLQALQMHKDAIHKESKNSIAHLRGIEKEYRNMLGNFGLKRSNGPEQLAEEQYLEFLSHEIENAKDSLLEAKGTLELTRLSLKQTTDSLAARKKIALLEQSVDSLSRHIAQLRREDSVIIVLGAKASRSQQVFEEKLQAKFVDWTFIKYLEKKQLIAELGKKEKTTAPGMSRSDSLSAIKDSAEKSEKLAYLNMSIVDDRKRLIEHIDALVRAYPASAYAPAVLMRLAELYYDLSSDQFTIKLREYEQKIAAGHDTAGVEFPEYNLSNTILTYERLIERFGESGLVDQALFYKAMALKKTGADDEAVIVLETLIKTYPQSEYYVEANMNLGRYYFEHPKMDDNTGYQKAVEAYRNVLYYRNHPQYIYALYQLGWCYYMQDHFDEAIAVFKYLIEEGGLDFDPSKTEEKQVVNPLLRGEAIDYIAISFDEEGRIDDAVKFLQLVGNVDYAALVLKRIGELREEDLDHPGAIKIYRRLLTEYPVSTSAPEAQASLIKIFEIMNKPDTALFERERFFSAYSTGSSWQKELFKRDTMLVKRVDSMAISIGLYVADDAYRKAETRQNMDEYIRAAQGYEMVVKNYPAHPRAVEARWNLAIILETRLNRKSDAYREYLTFSTITLADSSKREQSALNAIALAQKLLPPDSAVVENQLEFAALKLIEATNNYQKLFPQGKSVGKALLTQASVYFNRKLFNKAADVYGQIVALGELGPDYTEALFLLGQCHFGQDNWEAAAHAFEAVYKSTKDTSRKTEAFKLLLQSQFLLAKQLLAVQSYQKAAVAFIAIEESFPQSEYGDIVLFNAAQAFEKLEQWQPATDNYYRLFKSYPNSKLGPDALFNAALAFEHLNNYSKATEAYELLISRYGDSDKAKDALFNLGLSYEKLGKLDKMAEANERYSQKYPGEKDVEIMLLRSAQFYFKAGMLEKANTAYQNFIRRFAGNPKSIEAQYMVGKILQQQGKLSEATAAYRQAEDQNMVLAKVGNPVNNFYAAEAALSVADLKRNEFLAVKFVLPEKKMKDDQKLKTELMAEAAKGYQRVIQYQSEKMFEATYRIGQMYEDLARTFKDQERPVKLDPIKTALLDRDIKNGTATLLQKTFVPFQKTIELGLSFDSLKGDQKKWCDTAKTYLAKNYYMAGQLMVDAIIAMANAPIPSEILKEPLHHYQYLKQLLITLEQSKVDVRNYYRQVIAECRSVGIADENAAKCSEEFFRLSFAIGNEFDKLGESILKEPEIPKDIDKAAKEDLLFQFEDIVYELQDKAIFAYEDGMRGMQKENAQGSPWYRKIMQNLARLSPETYGKNFFAPFVVSSGDNWLVRSDSVGGWNTATIDADGWRLAKVDLQKSEIAFSRGSPRAIWSVDSSAKKLYFWKNVFYGGTPRDGLISIASSGAYRIYINGTLTSSDTTLNRDPTRIDTLSGITKLFKGGDNILAIEVVPAGTAYEGLMVSLWALVDTMQHFESQIKLPDILKKSIEKTAKLAAAEQAARPAPIKKNVEKAIKDTSAVPQQKEITAKEEKAKEETVIHEYKNRGELNNAISAFNKREQDALALFKKERMEFQKLKIQEEKLDDSINRVKTEIIGYTRALEEMHRKR